MAKQIYDNSIFSSGNKEDRKLHPTQPKPDSSVDEVRTIGNGGWGSDEYITKAFVDKMQEDMPSLNSALTSALEELKAPSAKPEPKPRVPNDLLRGIVPVEEGPVLKMCLTVRGRTVVGWIDYEHEALRKVLGIKAHFLASNGIKITADSNPQLSGNCIYLLGKKREYEKALLTYNLDREDEAEHYLNLYVEALEELGNVVKNIPAKEKELATRLDKRTFLRTF